MLRHASLTLNHLTFRLPEGRTLLEDLTFSIGPGRHALIGENGSGKSTLLKLITGRLRPTAGTVRIDGELGHLPQEPSPDPRTSVAELFGVAPTLRALQAIEEGSLREEDFDAVGEDWDITERVEAALDRVGLGGIELDRAAGSLSGGELVLLSLTAQVLRRPAVLLLDEPTNNLDAAARARLAAVLDDYPGTLLVISHDRELLERVDDLAELREGRLRWFGGGLSLYEEILAAEQSSAAQAVATARNDLRRQQRALVEQQRKQARRDRQGRKQAETMPKMVAHRHRGRAENSAAQSRRIHQERKEDAAQSLAAAEERLREDAEIRVDLPTTQVPAGRDVLRAAGLRSAHSPVQLDLVMRGPERIALTGPNGVGKTSLLQMMTGEASPAQGEAEVLVPFRHLPQDMRLLNPALSVLENVREWAPEADVTRIRHQLALFLLRGDSVHHPAGTLSGGERWRATLACVLLAEPAPQLLILDEPTNNLDLTSVRHLTEALRSHRGALLVVSHDTRFLDELTLDRRISLKPCEDQEDGEEEPKERDDPAV